jgi:hypothetical protein
MIATPTQRGGHPAYMRTLVKLTAELTHRGIEVDYRTSALGTVGNARNELADEFLRSDCSHCLWIDDDNAFEPDVAIRMLEADRELVAVAYPNRRGSGEPDLQDVDLCLFLDEEWYRGGKPEIVDGVVRGHTCGFGCVLMKRAPLERMMAPPDMPVYYSYVDGTRTIRGYFIESSNAGYHRSEDTSFFARYRAAGGQHWILADAEIEHWLVHRRRDAIHATTP